MQINKEYNKGQAKLLKLDQIDVGKSFAQLSLPDLLCTNQGNEVVCGKHNPCNDIERPANDLYTLAYKRSLNDILSGRHNKEYQSKLTSCDAQYKATVLGQSEISYLEKPVKIARLMFQDNILSRIKIEFGSNEAVLDRVKAAAMYSDNNDFITSISLKYGEPKIDTSYSVMTNNNTVCVGSSCSSVPNDSVYTIKEYTWRTSKERLHYSGNVLEIDLLR